MTVHHRCQTTISTMQHSVQSDTKPPSLNALWQNGNWSQGRPGCYKLNSAANNQTLMWRRLLVFLWPPPSSSSPPPTSPPTSPDDTTSHYHSPALQHYYYYYYTFNSLTRPNPGRQIAPSHFQLWVSQQMMDSALQPLMAHSFLLESDHVNSLHISAPASQSWRTIFIYESISGRRCQASWSLGPKCRTAQTTEQKTHSIIPKHAETHKQPCMPPIMDTHTHKIQ